MAIVWGFQRFLSVSLQMRVGLASCSPAIGGKTLRGSFDPAFERSLVHMINAWACDNGLVLGQLAVPDKSNEIPAVRSLLAILDLREATITADAMHCQRETAEQILAQGGDYALAVKSNQGKLHEDSELIWKLGEPKRQLKYTGSGLSEAVDSRRHYLLSKSCAAREAAADGEQEARPTHICNETFKKPMDPLYSGHQLEYAKLPLGYEL